MTTPSQRNPDYRAPIDRIRDLLTQKAPTDKPLPHFPPLAPEANVIDRAGQLLEAAAATLQRTGMARQLSR